MKNEEIINAWKDQKAHMEIGADLTDDVMKRIHRHEQKKAAPFFDIESFIEHVMQRPFARATLATAGLVGGFLRFGFPLYILLF